MKTEMFDRVNRINTREEEKPKSTITHANKDMSKEFIICMSVGIVIGAGIVFMTMSLLYLLGVI